LQDGRTYILDDSNQIDPDGAVPVTPDAAGCLLAAPSRLQQLVFAFR
jgi:hypothetical protein